MYLLTARVYFRSVGLEEESEIDTIGGNLHGQLAKTIEQLPFNL